MTQSGTGRDDERRRQDDADPTLAGNDPDLSDENDPMLRDDAGTGRAGTGAERLDGGTDRYDAGTERVTDRRVVAGTDDTDVEYVGRVDDTDHDAGTGTGRDAGVATPGRHAARTPIEETDERLRDDRPGDTGLDDRHGGDTDIVSSGSPDDDTALGTTVIERPEHGRGHDPA